jgi:hypothetical protein
MDEQFKREVVFLPAFDRRHPDPHQNYGIHGVDLRFHLIGEQGAAQLVVYTNWQLPHVTKEQDAKPQTRSRPHLLCHPMPADLGYHRLTPAYEGQTIQQDACDLLGGKPCYYDGSGLMAEDVFKALLEEGDAGVWRELERFYRRNVLDEQDDDD